MSACTGQEDSWWWSRNETCLARCPSASTATCLISFGLPRTMMAGWPWWFTNCDEEFCFFIPSGDLVELLFFACVNAENLSLYPEPVRAIELLKSPETMDRDILQVFVDCVELLPWLSFLLLDMFESCEALRVTVQEFRRR